MTPYRFNRSPLMLAAALAVGGLLTVSAGVAVAHRLPEQRMRAAFAWMVLCTAVWMLGKDSLLPLLGLPAGR